MTVTDAAGCFFFFLLQGRGEVETAEFGAISLYEFVPLGNPCHKQVDMLSSIHIKILIIVALSNVKNLNCHISFV